ncbi:MAG: 3',5'-cyclic-nucleotide phosphodiesterase [Sulfurovum sp.]
MRDYINFLGVNGARTRDKGSTSIQISHNGVIDAGNLIDGLGEDMIEIDTIFLTHSHLDHICDIPFLADDVIWQKRSPIKVYALKETIDSMREHIFNNKIWPDFTKIHFPNSNIPVVKLITIEIDTTYQMDGYTITPIKTNHLQGSCGYIIKQSNQGIFITADTYCSDTIWDRLNADNTIHTLCIDVSFPSQYDKLAKDSKHLTPKILKQELTKLKRDDLTVSIMHLKPSFNDIISQESIEYNILLQDGVILKDRDIIYFDRVKQKRNKNV